MIKRDLDSIKANKVEGYTKKLRDAEKHSHSFGSMIQAMRNQLGFTLKEVSEDIGISVAYLSDIEHNRRNPPLDEKLEKLLDTLHFDNTNRYKLYEFAGSRRGRIPIDMDMYLMENPTVKRLVRSIMNYDQEFTDGNLLEKEQEAILKIVENYIDNKLENK